MNQPTPFEKAKKLSELGSAFLILSALAVIFSRTIADPDLWGHLRFGLDMLRDGAITQTDPYSYLTAGARWINHEWLAEMLFGLAWLAGGSLGLVIFKTIMAFSTIGLIWRQLTNQGLNQLLVMALLLLMSLFFFSFLVLVRPQMFTFLLFTLLLTIIMQAEQGRYRALWAIPVIIALWTNLHGGVLAGLGIYGVWTGLHLFFQPKTWKQIIPPALVSCMGILVNPYGIDLPLFLFRTATVPRPEIVDWQPMQPFSIFGVLYLVILAVFVTGVVFSKQPRKPVPMLIFAFTIILPWVAVRHLPLFAIAAIVLTSEHVGSAWNRILPAKTAPLSKPGSVLFFGLSALLLMIGLMLKPQEIVITKLNMPDAAVTLLKQSNASGNLAVEFNWGQYAIWHLGPQIQVSMDGRRETIYPDAVYEENIRFMLGGKNWDDLLNQQPTDMALVQQGAEVYKLLKTQPGWQMIFEDAKSALFVHEKSAAAQTLVRAAANFTPPEADVSFP